MTHEQNILLLLYKREMIQEFDSFNWFHQSNNNKSFVWIPCVYAWNVRWTKSDFSDKRKALICAYSILNFDEPIVV